ncbi:MAG: tRNA (adenosine(37)-N6)-dimethylallyltransferase MiaA [Candidatus Cloacimonetes bacterium]|jgi:tRNA dimethylallyltransferase|nr:tRNA (adenosine(37)-N6)-dimethylallyltransferase MiaA [Candidatus Cloacimonadota bacterium]
MISLVTLEGPTASGKSELALRLALELGTDIISADSRQVYRYLDIGTAKPSAEALKAVKHHLVDIVDPSESYNAGRFCADAVKIIAELDAQGKLPLVCGGTGLYVDAILRGLFPQIEISTELRALLRQRLEQEGLDVLYQELAGHDPFFASGISSNDKQRILRGLEVFHATGLPISEHWRRQETKRRFTAFRILIDPPREILYERINARVIKMLDGGLLDEIRRLIDRGYGPASPGLNSVGYKEYFPHLSGEATLAKCAALAAQHTRNYAKRQCTWYRKHKFDLTLGSNECNISGIAGLIRDWQKSLN